MRRRPAVDTTAFYVPPSNIADQRVILPEEEARHLTRVLRISAGETITVVDGCGGRHIVVLDAVDKRSAVGRILSTVWDEVAPKYQLTLAVGVLKQASRFEMLVEKACELGVHRLVPIITTRTQKRSVRQDRLQQIAIAAMKQSGRSHLMQVTLPMPWSRALELEGARYICHEEGAPSAALQKQLVEAVPFEPQALCIMVGPEGGFSHEEVAEAMSAGFQLASLGPRRLRAETAGIVAATVVMMTEALHPPTIDP